MKTVFFQEEGRDGCVVRREEKERMEPSRSPDWRQVFVRWAVSFVFGDQGGV